MQATRVVGRVVEISHSNIDTSSKINAILSLIAREFEYEEAILFVLEKDNRLSCKFSNRESQILSILRTYRCHIGEGVIGTVLQRRMPAFHTIHNLPPRLGCLFFKGVEKVAASYKLFSFLPLYDDSFVYGVLLLCSAKRNSITHEEMVMLSIICREISGIFRFHDLMVSSRKRINELATLSEIGKVLWANALPQEIMKRILLIISGILDASFVSIHLLGGQPRDWTEKFAYGSLSPEFEEILVKLEREAIEERRLVSSKEILLNTKEDVYFLYCCPLISKNGICGTLSICKKGGTGSDYSDEDGYIVSTIAGYISNGVENIFLSSKLNEVITQLNETQKELIEQEKFKSLGEMLANIAHEIKNPLTAIGGFTKRLVRSAKLSEKEKTYANIIGREVERLERTLNNVLEYVKDIPLYYESCNINQCLDELLYLLSADPSWQGIEIEKSYEMDLPFLLCDTRQIRQVFLNILVNAFEAMHGQGKITIRTKKERIKNGLFVGIIFEDTGGGMDPNIVSNIFNPFFTTKQNGTGLGLAISNKIVKNHRGKIEVHNMVGKGAVFTVYLPVQLSNVL